MCVAAASTKCLLHTSHKYTIKKFIAMVYIMLCESLESVG